MNTAQLELNKRLLAAAKAGDAAELGRLLDAGASALARDEGSAGECALIHVCRIGSLDCVRLLLEHGANVNSTNFYTTPLMAACRNGHVEVARHLVEQGGADVNQSECEDLTALNYAAYSGSIELVDLLLDHGADIDNETWEGTALARVCRDGDERMGLHLLARGADPLRDPETLAGACEGGSLKLVQAVLEAWKKSGRDYVRELREDSPMEAAVAGADTFNPEVAQLMYDHGFRFDGMLGESGWWNRHGECDDDGDRLRWLRAHGAFDGPPKPLPDVSRECQSVVDAAEQGKDALLHMNADIETRDEDGCTPFLLACKKGMPAAAKRLADMGCDTAAVDAAGNTALMLAAACPGSPSPGRVRSCASLILWLAELGVDVNARDEWLQTPLMKLCLQSGDDEAATEMVRILLQHGADPALEDVHGETALDFARDGELTDIVELLENATNQHQTTP